MLEYVRTLTPYLTERLAGLLELPIIGDVRRRLLVAMEPVRGAENTRCAPAEGDQLLRGFPPALLRAAGIIARADDRGDGVLRIAPPLISDAAVLDEIVARLSGLLATPPGIYGRAVASVA